jgi:hypothetical protein
MPNAVPAVVPPNVVRDVTGFARALVAAHRTRRMYSAGHPATQAATERLAHATSPLAAYPDLHIGVAPAALLAAGEVLPAERRVAEAAAILHDHDILSLRVASVPAPAHVVDFLELVSADPARARDQGGPARIWRSLGHTSLDLVQIDYEAMLAGPSAPVGGALAPAAAARGADGRGRRAAETHDDIWVELVRSMSGRKVVYSAGARERIRQIAEASDDIAAFVTAAAEAVDEPAAARRRAAQAATVLTAFDRIVREIESSRPELITDTIRNIANAALRLDPALVMEVVGESTESGLGAAALRGMGDVFDDEKIADLLAITMAREGRATGRMAAALNTLVPEPDRRQRVLRLAHRMAAAPAAGAPGHVADAWTTLDQMLAGPSDTLYTSTDYAFQLQQTELRSHRLRLQVPKQLDEWVESVSAESVRTLSVTLLLDLFMMEDSPAGMTETAQDLARLAEDLLEAADFAETARVLRALDPARLVADPPRAEAGRHALNHLARSSAMGEVAAAAGDMDDTQYEWFRASCALLGPLVLPAILPSLAAASEGATRDRLSAIVIAFGPAAAGPLARWLAGERGDARRIGIQLAGRLGTPVAVSALQPLTVSPDVRVAREAILAVAGIDDPSARRCLANALRQGDREARDRAVEAVIAAGRPSMAPLLADALGDMQPFGPAFALALQTLNALRHSSDEAVVPAVTGALRAFDWRHVGQSMTFQRAAVDVLASMPCPGAAAALAEAGRTGGFLVKRYARAVTRAGA